MDLTIVATAVDLGATLVTIDGALLDGTIPGLAVENWKAWSQGVRPLRVLGRWQRSGPRVR